MKNKYKLIELDTVDSTNNYAKTLDISSLPCVVISDTQTAGRGRLGRSFSSPPGTGIYMSIALPADMITLESGLITIAAAVAVRRAIIEIAGKFPQIKWVNDLFLNQKKICGILAESIHHADNKGLSRIIIGIGVNCFPGSFPAELENIAGCISQDENAFSRSDLSQAIAEEVLSILTDRLKSLSTGSDSLSTGPNSLSTGSDSLSTGFGKESGNNEIDSSSARLNAASLIDEYKEACFILGKEITVTNFANKEGSTEAYPARALDISDSGELIVERLDPPHKGMRVALFSGEVSLHLG